MKLQAPGKPGTYGPSPDLPYFPPHQLFMNLIAEDPATPFNCPPKCAILKASLRSWKNEVALLSRDFDPSRKLFNSTMEQERNSSLIHNSPFAPREEGLRRQLLYWLGWRKRRGLILVAIQCIIIER